MKRFFDVSLAIVTLLLLSPVMIIVYWNVLKKIGRPVLFRQIRPGLKGQLFEMIKFRTMSNATNEQNQLLSDEQRLGCYGQFLRSSSLDELPELWNVLKGEMSLVGPRPLLEEYLPLYNKEQMRRHNVRPGVTGWAQVNGRNAISWVDKFKLDVWYVENQSLWLDFKIILLTVKKVIIREGVSAKGHVTVEPFKGSEE